MGAWSVSHRCACRACESRCAFRLDTLFFPADAGSIRGRARPAQGRSTAMRMSDRGDAPCAASSPPPRPPLRRSPIFFVRSPCPFCFSVGRAPRATSVACAARSSRHCVPGSPSVPVPAGSGGGMCVVARRGMRASACEEARPVREHPPMMQRARMLRAALALHVRPCFRSIHRLHESFIAAAIHARAAVRFSTACRSTACQLTAFRSIAFRPAAC